MVKEKIGGALAVRAVMGKFGRQNLGGEKVLWVRTSLSDQPSHGPTRMRCIVQASFRNGCVM